MSDKVRILVISNADLPVIEKLSEQAETLCKDLSTGTGTKQTVTRLPRGYSLVVQGEQGAYAIDMSRLWEGYEIPVHSHADINTGGVVTAVVWSS